MRIRPLALLAAPLLAGACAPPPAVVAPAPVPAPRMETVTVLASAPAQAAGFAPGLRATLDSIARAALADSAAPAIAMAVGRHGRLVHLAGYGAVDWAAGSSAVTDSTLFDLASVTKVVATTTAAMILEEEGRLDIDRTVASYLPELTDSAKQAITVRMLLTHRGGLESFAPLFREFRGREQYLRQINLRPLRSVPGTQTVYSDWDLILMQLVIERITGQPLDEFVRDRVFAPLGMRETGFRPALPRDRIAATERDSARGGLIWGEVHDPNAWAMGGVAGHAGLFGSARDLAVFAQMLLNGGEYGGVRILRPQTIARWTAQQGPGSSRALGWDTPSGESSGGHFFSPRSFGHTGYTGTSIWMDPERGLFVVLLTTRVNPTSANQKQAPLRRAVADAVQSAIVDAPLIDWEARRKAAEPAPQP
ncbi:serine hydrolase domain-containing protein [Longimicrobium sp.]|uniref:serine hydrolase domain-containing protein n=1 Tax=Longimicrobium sp. TaxID=2029185 RepID=UPI002E3762C8|nr:serine hydrolase [Longimicrobium sp.]HEX6036443.1 serine hydrolase [Longimicrobium sp.]